MAKAKRIAYADLAHFSPKQEEACRASKRFRFVFYGGSMGSGKSYFLRWMCLYWLFRFHMQTKKLGIRVALFCEDYPSLMDRHISKVKAEFPDWMGKYNEQSHEFRLEPRFGGGVICFRNLDDPSKYQSSEFAMIAVDELPKNPFTTFSMLRTRMRWPGIAEPRFIGAGNPGGEAWVKQYFIDRAFPVNEQEKGDFCYIKALPTDNPHLPQDYFRSLESLPEAERRAYLEGDWSAFEDTTDDRGFSRLLTDSELQNSVVDNFQHLGELVMGVDPAGGGDNDAIVIASDTFAEVVFNQKLKDIMQLVVVIVDLAAKYRVRHICVDSTGIGQGVVDRLRELAKREGLNIHPVIFGAKSRFPDRFANLKAELFWGIRDWVIKGGKLKRNDGWGEMTLIKWKKDTDRVIEMQSKSDLRSHGIASPNVADALVIAHSYRPVAQNLRTNFKRLMRRSTRGVSAY